MFKMFSKWPSSRVCREDRSEEGTGKQTPTPWPSYVISVMRWFSVSLGGPFSVRSQTIHHSCAESPGSPGLSSLLGCLQAVQGRLPALAHRALAPLGMSWLWASLCSQIAFSFYICTLFLESNDHSLSGLGQKSKTLSCLWGVWGLYQFRRRFQLDSAWASFLSVPRELWPPLLEHLAHQVLKLALPFRLNSLPLCVPPCPGPDTWNSSFWPVTKLKPTADLGMEHP